MASSETWIPSTVNRYHKITRTHFFGLLIVLLLLVIYETSSVLAYQEGRIVLRNAAEVMIKRTFWYAGLWQPIAHWIVYLILLAWSYWLAQKDKLTELRVPYFAYVIFESLIYALSLSSIIHLFSRAAVIRFLGPDGAGLGMGERMTLAIGAGVYEELLFRFGILGALLFFFKKTWPVNPVAQQLLALTISAVLFSTFHYWSGREAVAADSFFYRFYAGLILGFLYIWRGLGVAAYTHAFYDLLLVFQRPPST